MRANRRSTRGLLWLVLALVLAFGSSGSVRASPVRCFEPPVEPADDFFTAEATIIVRADGTAYLPEPELVASSVDPTGDAVNRAGSPTSDPDARCAAMLKLIEPGAPALEALGFVDTANFQLVVPGEPSPELADATELVAVAVEFGGTFPGSATGVAQFGISFDSALFPNYAGSALELVGRDTTFDVYLDGGVWTLGRTEYRDGQFSFAANSNQFAAIIGNGRATILFPETVVPESVNSVGFFAVLGSGVDVVDIGVFDPANLNFVARSGAVVAPPPTASPTASPAPAATPTTTPGPGGGGVSTTDGSGGVSWLLPAGLAAVALIAAGLVAIALRSRRPSVATTSITEDAARVIATDVASTPLAGRAWKVADIEQSGPRTALLVAGGLVALLVVGGAIAVATGV